MTGAARWNSPGDDSEVERVRLLFTFAGGEGHLQPMLPLATRAAASGHAVTVTGTRSLGPAVRRAEYRVVGEHFAGRLAAARVADLLVLCRKVAPT